MRFHELPYRLRLYLLAHLLVLAPLYAVLVGRPAALDGWPLLALLLCTLIFSTWKIELTVLNAKMTLTFAAICLALLLQGIHGAVLCAFVGAGVGSMVRPNDGCWKVRLMRPPFYRAGFNLANCILACLLAAVLYEFVKSLAPSSSKGMVAGLTVFTTAYFAINTVGVSLAIALQQGLSVWKVWQESFLWTAPGYFASASAAAGITMAYSYVGLWSLFLVPPLYVVYYSYKLYMDRMRLNSEKLSAERDHIHALNEINHAIIVSLATAIDAKDSCTSSHIDRVQLYATALASAAGIRGPEFEAVRVGALVHDIGKLGVPDHILGKPGKLTPEEFKRIQTHVTIGAEILTPIPFPFPVVDVVLSHHERWDGLGYPNGLEGEAIPIGGRIISIVDVFDALTSDRPYRRAMTSEAAMENLRQNAGKQFDPDLVEMFARVLPEVSEEIRRMRAAGAGEGHTDSEPEAAPYVQAQIREAAAESAALSDISDALAKRQTVEGIGTLAIERALSLLPVDTVVLYRSDPEAGDLVAVAVGGKDEAKLRGMRIRAGEGVAGAVASSRQARVNVSAASDIARRFVPEETVELTAATAVPLLHRSEVLGVLAVYTMAYCVVNATHVDILQTLAHHTAAAIDGLRQGERVPVGSR